MRDVLIIVPGSSGLDAVAGVPAGHPASLLRVVAKRPDQVVVVLASEHVERQSRTQAELVAAVRPHARVEVVVSAHHELTLTLVADRVLRSVGLRSGPEDMLTRIHDELAAARSLLWCSSAWRLRGAGLGLGQRLRIIGAGAGSFVDLVPATRTTDARVGWRPRPDDRLYVAGPIPALPDERLEKWAPQRVHVEIEPSAPYASRSVQLLTALSPGDAFPSVPTTDLPQKSEAA